MTRPTTNPAAVLAAQQIAHHAFAAPREVVKWLDAVQAQDYTAVTWAVGLRLPGDGATDASIERVLADGAIVRTHAMR